MLKKAALLVTLAVLAAVLVQLLLTSGHLVGPLVYLFTSAPSRLEHMPTLRKIGLLPTHCTLVTADAHQELIAEYTPPNSDITADKKIALLSASKIVSAIIILSVFPEPEQILLRDVLPKEIFSSSSSSSARIILEEQEEERQNITIRELLSFTSGLEQGKCEAQATGWGRCVQELLQQHYRSEKRGKFMYARSHLSVAGYAAVVYSNQTWHQLLERYVIEPANIQPAPIWDEPEFSHGHLAFDAPIDFWGLRDAALQEHRKRLEHHAVPSSALSGSAKQIAALYKAILDGRIGDEEFRRKLFQPHIPAARVGLWAHYASGNWRGKRIAHSQGMLGTFPFIVMDKENPWIGVFVMDRRRSPVWQKLVSLGRSAHKFMERFLPEDSSS